MVLVQLKTCSNKITTFLLGFQGTNNHPPTSCLRLCLLTVKKIESLKNFLKYSIIFGLALQNAIYIVCILSSPINKPHILIEVIMDHNWSTVCPNNIKIKNFDNTVKLLSLKGIIKTLIHDLKNQIFMEQNKKPVKYLKCFHTIHNAGTLYK